MCDHFTLEIPFVDEKRVKGGGRRGYSCGMGFGICIKRGKFASSLQSK